MAWLTSRSSSGYSEARNGAGGAELRHDRLGLCAFILRICILGISLRREVLLIHSHSTWRWQWQWQCYSGINNPSIGIVRGLRWMLGIRTRHRKPDFYPQESTYDIRFRTRARAIMLWQFILRKLFGVRLRGRAETETRFSFCYWNIYAIVQCYVVVTCRTRLLDSCWEARPVI